MVSGNGLPTEKIMSTKGTPFLARHIVIVGIYVFNLHGGSTMLVAGIQFIFEGVVVPVDYGFVLISIPNLIEIPYLQKN